MEFIDKVESTESQDRERNWVTGEAQRFWLQDLQGIYYMLKFSTANGVTVPPPAAQTLCKTSQWKTGSQGADGGLSLNF